MKIRFWVLFAVANFVLFCLRGREENLIGVLLFLNENI